jgi:hypothetical protein
MWLSFDLHKLPVESENLLVVGQQGVVEKDHSDRCTRLISCHKSASIL